MYIVSFHHSICKTLTIASCPTGCAIKLLHLPIVLILSIKQWSWRKDFSFFYLKSGRERSGNFWNGGVLNKIAEMETVSPFLLAWLRSERGKMEPGEGNRVKVEAGTNGSPRADGHYVKHTRTALLQSQVQCQEFINLWK